MENFGKHCEECANGSEYKYIYIYGYAFDIQISMEDMMELFVCVEMNEVYTLYTHYTIYIGRYHDVYESRISGKGAWLVPD